MSLHDTQARAADAVLQCYLDRLLGAVPEHRAEDTCPGGAPTAPVRECPTAPTPPAPRPVAPAPAGWREAAFQALLFRCGGLELAAPLIRLCGVIPWPGQLAATAGGPEWYLGLLRHLGQNVRVVDTAKLVLEGRNIDAEVPACHVILFDEGRWGMSCSALSEVLTLAPETVQWRRGNGKRPWLAGTVRERLCAVIDVDAFAAMLEAGGGNAGRLA